MNIPTKSQFRLLSFAGVSVIVFASLLELIGFPRATKEIMELMKWNEYDLMITIASYQTFQLMMIGAFLIGVITFLGFWKWSRYILLGCILVSTLGTGIQTVVVARGLTEALMGFGGLLFVFPFVLSFFPPCNHYFGD